MAKAAAVSMMNLVLIKTVEPAVRRQWLLKISNRKVVN